MQLGISYLRQNKLQLARTKLETAIRLDPNLATAHAALGVVFERLEDPAGAERHYRRAVDLNPQSPDNLNALAVFTCQRKRDPKEALRLFDRALAIPLSVSAANRAMLNTNAGTCAKSIDLLRAEGYLRAALIENPQLQRCTVPVGRNHAGRRRGTAGPGVHRALSGGQLRRRRPGSGLRCVSSARSTTVLPQASYADDAAQAVPRLQRSPPAGESQP